MRVGDLARPSPLMTLVRTMLNFFNAGPGPVTRPPGASGPGGGQARDGNKKPVRGAQRNGNVEDLGMTVHGTQGAGLEGCSLDVDTEQLIAERVHASPCLRSPHLARMAACRQKIVGPHTITITIIAAAGITQKLVAHAHP